MKTLRVLVALTACVLLAFTAAPAQFFARDPGVRGGPAGAGGMIGGLSSSQQTIFTAGQDAFQEAETVGNGLGPRFNLDSCAGCHAQPAVGGSSPAVNPQVALATAFGARNAVPSFIALTGPVREARFKLKPDGTPDGGVHALYVISGRNDGTDASGCTAVQENFEAQVAANNVIFRIPTPTFGAGLIEMIPDSAIVANLAANSGVKSLLGIHGRPNRMLLSGEANHNGNDGTIARFGWKAQNKSLMIFTGEAYNVEMGITNELFQTEREENPTCQFKSVPNDTTNTDGATGIDTLSDVEKFALFMRFLAPPMPSPDTPGGADSIGRGKVLFSLVGCALCHTPQLRTSAYTTVAALVNQPVNLYSDLAVHNMGPGLADDVSQGQAHGDEFRTAPLWGLGQRIFLLHDGRTTDLRHAIVAHKSLGNFKYQASEANVIVDRFNALNGQQTLDLFNFLRSL